MGLARSRVAPAAQMACHASTGWQHASMGQQQAAPAAALGSSLTLQQRQLERCTPALVSDPCLHYPSPLHPCVAQDCLQLRASDTSSTTSDQRHPFT